MAKLKYYTPEKKEKVEEVKAPSIVTDYFKALCLKANTARTKPDRSKLPPELFDFAKLIPSIAAYLLYATLFDTLSIHTDIGAQGAARETIKELILSLIKDTNIYPLHEKVGYSGATQIMRYVDIVANLASYFLVLNEEGLAKFITGGAETKNIWSYVPQYINDEFEKPNIKLTEGLARKTAVVILLARWSRISLANSVTKAVDEVIKKELITD